MESLVDESKMFEKLKHSDTTKYKTDTALAVERLEFILSKKSENLINIFRLDGDESDQDFELTILRAFLNCKFTFIRLFNFNLVDLVSFVLPLFLLE